MAPEDKDQQGDAKATTSTAGGSAGAPYTRLPNGIIVDKDGKPCRSCNSKSAFSAFAAQATKQSKRPKVECPPDVETLGRCSWTLLHSIAATYPEKPTTSQQSDVVSFVKLFSKLYPCWVCAEDFQGYIAKSAPKAGSRSELGDWMCKAHNDVNVKLGKPTFDCSKWEERWVTGPKDGSCD
ncbi:ERV/ALR sulfhydryl oxidase domain-containing protein [Emericellopsis atlantica]|uniref:Sulfhydryl oxidase n=1 Tax=Emericellopsis atlantica TaxID=2614577 RepID=A0A9P7ZEF5_9HYPO|nr:ERV/ALR sulfhydryl oxidase domain-containing protein [Emericellopsis atlantica]KAG9250157.1 ERV/ALR sulfhydryl oxidase domain-containing protein [Emericellopsis atlantica]